MQFLDVLLMWCATIWIRFIINVIMYLIILLVASLKVLLIIQLLLLHFLLLLVLISLFIVDVFVAIRLLQFFLLFICDLLLDLILHFDWCLDLTQTLHKLVIHHLSRESFLIGIVFYVVW